ncbi:MAG: hypothetical protein AAGI23_20470 [Bacteroidota bacterium]
MTNTTPFIWLPIGLGLFIACASQTEQYLVGDWQVNKLIEAEREIHFDELKEVRFSFYENGKYTFSSTLNYREAGRYERRGNFLHTTDTLQRETKERRVKIMQSKPDFLQLRMMTNNKERVLHLVKIDSI